MFRPCSFFLLVEAAPSNGPAMALASAGSALPTYMI
jgi:hypothetical protein